MPVRVVSEARGCNSQICPRTLDLGHLVERLILGILSGAYADKGTGDSGLEAGIEADVRKEVATDAAALKVLQAGWLFLARSAFVFVVVHFALSVGVDI